MKWGDIVHYRWSDYSDEAGQGHQPHSASMYVGPSARNPLEFVQLPLADTHYQFGMMAPLVAKSVAAWELCTDACPFNPDYAYKEFVHHIDGDPTNNDPANLVLMGAAQ